MPTVYSRIQSFYLIDKFRFKENHKQRIGIRLSALYKQIESNLTLGIVESIEDSGTYKVYDYPDSFTPFIDQMIKIVHREILDASRSRRKKIALSSLPDKPTQEPPSSPVTLPKTRKRTPVKKIPAWKSK